MDCWYFLALSGEIKAGKQVRRMLLGEPIVIGRTTAGNVFALRDICPHRLVPLSAGRQLETDGEPTLECPYHGWRFGTDGVCRLLPSLTEDDATDPSRIRVRRYPAHEVSGAIFVFVASDPKKSDAPQDGLPDLGHFSTPPRIVADAALDLSAETALPTFADPEARPLLPAHWTWHPLNADSAADRSSVDATVRGWLRTYEPKRPSSTRLKTMLGREIELHSQYEAPGFRWDKLSTPKATLLTLTCLVPAGSDKTRMVQLAWCEGAPLLRFLVSPGPLNGFAALPETV